MFRLPADEPVVSYVAMIILIIVCITFLVISTVVISGWSDDKCKDKDTQPKQSKRQDKFETGYHVERKFSGWDDHYLVCPICGTRHLIDWPLSQNKEVRCECCWWIHKVDGYTHRPPVSKIQYKERGSDAKENKL